MDKPLAIGIDLGTTYSCVAVYDSDVVKIISNEVKHNKTPSYVAFTKNDYLLVGEEAKSQATINSKNTINNIKRLIGRRMDDESVQSIIKYLPFDVVDNGGKPYIATTFKDENRQFSPEEITSMILLKMKETAELYLGATVTDAVITVPAYFNNSQRQATRNAGEIAGLNVLRIINETSASAIAYGLKNRAQGERNVMIFDLGGGTLDVSIVAIDDGMFEVKSTSGNTCLGGLDFDNRLVEYFGKEIKRKHRKDISNDKKAMRRLRNACEQAKQTLSTSNEAKIEIRSLVSNVDYSTYITRTKFEEMCFDLFAQIMESVNQTVTNSQIHKSNIHEILLVGGSSRMPKVRQMLQDFFNGKKLNILDGNESVAYGAAVQAVMIIEDKTLDDLLLVDVTPLTLGIETFGKTMAPLIKQNTTVPVKVMRSINSADIQQTNLGISVYEGENKFVNDNNLIRRFILKGIKPPNKSAVIEVMYELDFDGILHLTAGYGQTNTQIQIATSQSANFIQSELDQMQKRIVKLMSDDEKLRNQKLVKLEDVWYCVLNVKLFECPFCFEYCKPGEGIVLRECGHLVCRNCLKRAIECNEEVQVACPLEDPLSENKKCKYFLQHREIKELVSKQTYERYLRMSLSVAEQQFENSFHCKTADCPGWCVFECAHFFDCPVCKHQNCINCQVIHEGKDCKQYQDNLLLKAAHDEEAQKTKLYLEEQLTNGLAMHCPKCRIIIHKIDGCDGVICTMCKTDICWATKGPRWGPGGRGDTSGGCKCGFGGQRCHPNCRNCH